MNDAASLRISAGIVVLRSKKIEDAEQDYRWRADPELSHLDASEPITLPLKEYKYLHKQQLLSPVPDAIRFAIETVDGLHIGNCMCYDIDTFRKEAELGIMIGRKEYWGKGYGRTGVKVLADYCFRERNLEKLFLHTLVSNLRARRAFTMSGFKDVAEVLQDGHRFMRMETLRKEWFQIQNANP